MRHNEHEIPQLEPLARSLGVDAMSIKTLNPYDHGECHSAEADGLAFMPEDPRYQRFQRDPETGERLRVRWNPCKRLWNDPVVAWNGKVSPCAFDPHQANACGDVTQQTFRDIWHGEAYARLRRQFRKDYKDLPLCNGCTYAFKGGAVATDAIASIRFFT
jgi:radical SAM protein with 4Fe4S-binding SPASM domain